MLALLTLICASSLPTPVHPNSVSSSRITVRGAQLELEIRCQVAALAECIELDLDRDMRLDERELDAGRAGIASYLLRHYTWEPAASAPVRTSVEVDAASTFDDQYVRARFAFEYATAPERLDVWCRLFLEQNPLHRDTATIVWNDDPPLTYVFLEGIGPWRFEPADMRRPGVLGSFVHLGVEHIATGFDHIAFLVALILASRRLKSLIGVVTAFTAAHSITLAAAALDLVHVPSRLVELAIALSIAYVAAENLIVKAPRSRWIEAFVFGLVHGLGFAGFLSDSLIFEPLKFTALLGFNLGVECGQVAIVLAVALLLRWLPGDRSARDDARAWFAPRWLRASGSVVVTVLGLWWFCDRAGWLPWGS